MTAPTRFAAIVNPQAADGKTARDWPVIRSHFENTVGPLTDYVTQAPQHAIELARAAVRRGHRVIIAVGGDGTLNEVVNGLFENDATIDPEVTLALIPRGTGSDFRQTVRLPLDPRLAVDALKAATARPLDLMRLRFRSHEGQDRIRYSINVTSFGMGGIVSERAKRYSKYVGGKLSFVAATLFTSLGFRGREVRLEMDGRQSVAARILNVAVGNGQYHGAGMWICPRASLDDGLLDVTIIEYMSPLRVAKDMKLLYNGRVYTHPRVRFHRVARISASAAQETLIEIDGEPLGRLPLEMEVLPRAVRFLSTPRGETESASA